MVIFLLYVYASTWKHTINECANTYTYTHTHYTPHSYTLHTYACLCTQTHMPACKHQCTCAPHTHTTHTYTCMHMYMHTLHYLVLVVEVLDNAIRVIVWMLVERREESEVTQVSWSLIAHVISHTMRTNHSYHSTYCNIQSSMISYC